MAITQVGVATLSEELLNYIKEQIKNGTLSFTDLIDAPDYAGQDGKFLQAQSGGGTNSMTWQSLPSAGLNWQVEDEDFLAEDKIGILASNGITITLPSDPEEGNLVAIADHLSEFDTNPVTIVGSGGFTIEGDEDLVLDLRNAYVQLIFSTDQWEIAQVNHPFNVQEITEETFPAGQITYTLSRVPPTRASILVTVNGAVVPTAQYSLIGNQLSFGAVTSNSVSVRHIGIPTSTQVADVPVGAMLYFPNTEPVEGWLDCTGGTIPATVYPDLVEFLTKDPTATTAFLPDARGNFIRTWDHGNGTDTVSNPISNVLATNELGKWMQTIDPSTARNAFDGSTASRTTVRVDQERVGYAFDNPTVVTQVVLNSNDAVGTVHLPDTVQLQASTDGITWVDASAVTPGGSALQGRNVTLVSTLNSPYRFWAVKGVGGQAYPENPEYYWGVSQLTFSGTTGRTLGSFQEESVGPIAAPTLNGTSLGSVPVQSGAGTNVLGQGGSGALSGGTETRPSNISYVLRIKAFHFQSGELAPSEVTALRGEVSRLATQVNDGTSYVQEDPPENPSENARWYDTTSGRTYIWFNDGDSYQWVDDSPQSASTAQESLNAAEILSIGSTTPRALNERFVDVVNVKDFGAVGDWNTSSQSGSDDSIAIQSAIDSLNGQTRRNGGAPILYFPPGNYYVSNTISLNNSGLFNFLIKGEGWDVTTIYGNVGPTNYVFDSSLEFYSFSDIAIMGNSSESRVGMARGILKAYNAVGAADVDVHFTDCYFGWADQMCNITGRGFTQSNCVNVNINYVCDIASPDPWVQRGSNETDKYSTGMRHYTIKGCKFDVCSRVVRTPSVGPAAPYINDVNISGNTFAAVDRLIEVGENGIGGRLLHSTISSNTAINSFAGGIVTGNDVRRMSIDGNVFSKSYDLTINPSSTGETIDRVFNLRNAQDIVVSNNVISTLRLGVGITSSLGFMQNVIVESNIFSGYTQYSEDTDTYVLLPVNEINADSLVIRNNTFDSMVATTTSNWYTDPSIGSDKLTISGNLSRNFSMNRHLSNFTPILYIDGVVSTDHTVNVSEMNWYTDESYLYAVFNCSFSDVTGSGSIGVSVPIPSIREDSVSSVSAIGNLSSIFGVSLASGVPGEPTLVEGGQITLRKLTTTGTSNLTVSELASGSVSFIGSIKYRYK